MDGALREPLRADSGETGGTILALVVGGSVLVHALLIGLLVLLSHSEPPRLDVSQKPVKARLVRLGKPRDKNLLPRIPTASADPVKTVSVPSANPVPASASEPSPGKSTSSKDGPKSTKERRRSLFDAFATAGKAEELPGQEDGDPNGDAEDATEGERYFGLILARARSNYGITKTIPPQELIRLKAIVVLYIGPTGELLKDPEIQTTSGNPQFDQDVILSLRKAAPFGPPPENLASTLKTVGVAIEATP